MFSYHLSSTQHQLPQGVGDWALGTIDFSLFACVCTEVHSVTLGSPKEKEALVETFLDTALPD